MAGQEKRIPAAVPARGPGDLIGGSRERPRPSARAGLLGPFWGRGRNGIPVLPYFQILCCRSRVSFPFRLLSCCAGSGPGSRSGRSGTPGLPSAEPCAPRTAGPTDPRTPEPSRAAGFRSGGFPERLQAPLGSRAERGQARSPDSSAEPCCRNRGRRALPHLGQAPRGNLHALEPS